MRRLAREAGMCISLGGGEAGATLTLPPPSLLSLVRETAYDVAALRQAEPSRMAANTTAVSSTDFHRITGLPIFAAE